MFTCTVIRAYCSQTVCHYFIYLKSTATLSTALFLRFKILKKKNRENLYHSNPISVSVIAVYAFLRHVDLEVLEFKAEFLNWSLCTVLTKYNIHILIFYTRVYFSVKFDPNIDTMVPQLQHWTAKPNNQTRLFLCFM